MSVFGVQPRLWQPWAGATNQNAIFVPGRLSYGADENGGYYERAFGTYVEAGSKWESPRVRLLIGPAAPQALKAYAVANGITRRLEDKISAPTLAKLKNSVLVFVSGSAREKIDNLKYLPLPSQIHFADYLKGGFDKEYPDHVPPNARFGTAQEMRELFDKGHQSGHLVVPYTNPTWWADNPRGPTFLKAGEAPLLIELDGKPAYEKYGTNDGWTITFWHPAVRAANRTVRSQFSKEYPVDVLFQDQVGARGWRYDLNPASPTPYAYIEGMLSQAAEDAQIKPLSTENGWDQIINMEVQFAGLSFGTVPTENPPEWRRLVKEEIPPTLWEIYPLAHYLAHDKVAFIHHDLGQFVTNQEVLSWTLGLGYNMSYRNAAPVFAKDSPREWLNWLDRLQKSICARYVGQPITRWQHARGASPTLSDDGIIRATYGPVQITSNLGPTARMVDNRTLAPYGFYATAPGMSAGHLMVDSEPVSFVVQKTSPQQTDVWVYAEPQAQVKVPLSARTSGTLKFKDGAMQRVAANASSLTLQLPARGAAKRILPPAEIGTKPLREWARNTTIGIINYGTGVSASWTSTTPEMWKQAFDNSRVVREWGATTRFLTTPQEVMAALQAGPQAYFAIINAYPERLPMSGAGQWKASLDAIRNYTEHGGNWWETAGHSFFVPIWQQDGKWQTENAGSAATDHLGLSVGSGEVVEATQSLQATADGRKWLGDELSRKIAASSSMVNRFLPRGGSDRGHITLVAGEKQDFIGGYQLNGWGWLWRIGGFHPNPEVAVPVVVAATEYLLANPPQPIRAPGTKYLWHAVLLTPQATSKAATSKAATARPSARYKTLRAFSRRCSRERES
jgi:hypothetical protein